MEARTKRLYEAALGAEHYRGFLGGVFDALAETSRNKRFNYSSFARKAGLQSRGFAKEVVTGRKRLTAQSYPRFERALSLPTSLRKYFGLLVALEEPDAAGTAAGAGQTALEQSEIRKRIEELKEAMRAELLLAERGSSLSEEVFRSTHIMAVYAVLGDRDKGAALDDVARKTRLHPAVCSRVLEHLIEQRLAVVKDGRYRSISPHLVFQRLKGDHPCRNAFLETAAELKRRATEDFDGEDRLFIHSYFTVDRKRLPELKKRLWRLVLEYVDESDSNDGDSVHRLLVGLFP